MKIKRKVNAGMLIEDIRAGVQNSELIEKYDLSPKLLQRALVKLVERGDFDPRELAGRITPPDLPEIESERRRTPRQYPALTVHVREEGYEANRGTVIDISEIGLRVQGIEAVPLEVKTLVIYGDELDVFETFSFAAICRWVRQDLPDGALVAGFEITQVSDRNFEQLLNLTQLQTVSFG